MAADDVAPEAIEKLLTLREEVSLKPTLYERVSSFLFSLLLFTGIVVAFLGALWLTNRIWGGAPPVRPVTLVELPGGDLQGDVNAEEDVIDPAVQPELLEVETVDQVVEDVVNVLSNQPVVADPETFVDPLATSEGPIGRRKFGNGPGTGGLPREERWLITYPAGQSLAEYAQLLDSFGIELGVIANGGRLYVLSNLSARKPRVRVVSPEEEKRLYLTWRAGDRKKADLQLAKKAGIEKPLAVIQFIPPPLEQKLAELERAYKGLTPDRIISTQFKLRKRGNRWEFYVARQIAAM